MNTIAEETTSDIDSENLGDSIGEGYGDNNTAVLIIKHLFQSRDTSFRRPSQKHQKTMDFLMSVGAVELKQVTPWDEFYFDYVLTYTWVKRVFGPVNVSTAVTCTPCNECFDRLSHSNTQETQSMEDLDDFFDRNKTLDLSMI